MKNLWIDITALVYSLGFRSVNALEDHLQEQGLDLTAEDERMLVINDLLTEVGAEPLAV